MKGMKVPMSKVKTNAKKDGRQAIEWACNLCQEGSGSKRDRSVADGDNSPEDDEDLRQPEEAKRPKRNASTKTSKSQKAPRKTKPHKQDAQQDNAQPPRHVHSGATKVISAGFKDIAASATQAERSEALLREMEQETSDSHAKLLMRDLCAGPDCNDEDKWSLSRLLIGCNDRDCPQAARGKREWCFACAMKEFHVELHIWS